MVLASRSYDGGLGPWGWWCQATRMVVKQRAMESLSGLQKTRMTARQSGANQSSAMRIQLRAAARGRPVSAEKQAREEGPAAGARARARGGFQSRGGRHAGAPAGHQTHKTVKGRAIQVVKKLYMEEKICGAEKMGRGRRRFENVKAAVIAASSRIPQKLRRAVAVLTATMRTMNHPNTTTKRV